jgi:hypothetical protein
LRVVDWCWSSLCPPEEDESLDGGLRGFRDPGGCGDVSNWFVRNDAIGRGLVCCRNASLVLRHSVTYEWLMFGCASTFSRAVVMCGVAFQFRGLRSGCSVLAEQSCIFSVCTLLERRLIRPSQRIRVVVLFANCLCF